ncbi:hypothetical protein Egran_01878 [Elaphomyces granulatus]|uniref:DUF2293 domain-containing protein n=1 Tax=Elaphomyces granulatus TaxID=519963 RepID=A0A232M1S3_9EURO|nr:hypothetical protein Egran_01878 [Elaphomyces granulatus]
MPTTVPAASNAAENFTSREPSRHTKLGIHNIDLFERTCVEGDPMPTDYVFVPKGDVYITRHCKSQTKNSKRNLYIVYDNRGKRSLGIRVPADTYLNVVEQAAETADSRATAVKHRDEKYLSQARSLLRAQFPDMPASVTEKVLQHAYMKGSGRVGRKRTVKDERKIRLAVEAHIRHAHTEYKDMLEAGVDRQTARDRVWDSVQDLRDKWGGSDNKLKARSTERGVKKARATGLKSAAATRSRREVLVNLRRRT